MKVLITVAASLISLAVAAGLALVFVLVLAGPHSDILPSWLRPAVFVLAWMAVVAVPFIVGRSIWRRMHSGRSVPQTAAADRLKTGAG